MGCLTFFPSPETFGPLTPQEPVVVQSVFFRNSLDMEILHFVVYSKHAKDYKISIQIFIAVAKINKAHTTCSTS